MGKSLHKRGQWWKSTVSLCDLDTSSGAMLKTNMILCKEITAWAKKHWSHASTRFRNAAGSSGVKWKELHLVCWNPQINVFGNNESYVLWAELEHRLQNPASEMGCWVVFRITYTSYCYSWEIHGGFLEQRLLPSKQLLFQRQPLPTPAGECRDLFCMPSNSMASE